MTGPILIIGYGNPGRGDDGLGPVLADRIANLNLPGVRVDIDYQLTVEHAAQVAQAGQVVFVDAQMTGQGAVSFEPVACDAVQTLGSHSLAPAAVMRLARDLFGATPPAYQLGITGKEFGRISEGLSPQALSNLGYAERFLARWLRRAG